MENISVDFHGPFEMSKTKFLSVSLESPIYNTVECDEAPRKSFSLSLGFQNGLFLIAEVNRING